MWHESRRSVYMCSCLHVWLPGQWRISCSI